MNLIEFAGSEGQDQTAQMRSLIRTFAVHLQTLEFIDYTDGQSEYLSVQSDLGLRYPHTG